MGAGRCFWIVLAVFAVQARGQGQVPWLTERTVRESDTLAMHISSSLGRPLRYRVLQSNDSTPQHWLRLELQYAAADSLIWRQKTTDKQYQNLGQGKVRVTIPLKRPVAWKVALQDSDLVLRWISPETRPLWKNPWVVAGAGGVLAGGLVVWMLQGNSNSGGSQDDVIPPPDVVLPP
jgi:hypothetical protein